MRWSKLVGVGGAGVALAVLVGCGGSGGSGGSTGAGAGAGSGGATVSARDIPGVGSTLVNSDGKTLYFADQESGGQIKCVSDCLKFWAPLTLPGGTNPTAGTGVDGTLAMLSRPDGSSQVTYDGKPLYTFTQDGGAGKASGNGFKDSFGGVSFDWHAAAAVSGSVPTSAPTATDTGGGTGYGY